MPRPSRADARRRELLPEVARTFAELGYRRATTAELAARCGIQENVLYRLWPDKKAMFLAAIELVYEGSREVWERLEAEGDGAGAARRILEYEAAHHGEYGFHRIVFGGLSEADDPEIREALRRMYGRFQEFIRDRIVAHRRAHGGDGPDADRAAWAVVGLGTMINIGRELDLLDADGRRGLMREIGEVLLARDPRTRPGAPRDAPG
jgi:AcrR family transcriptional regulator